MIFFPWFEWSIQYCHHPLKYKKINQNRRHLFTVPINRFECFHSFQPLSHVTGLRAAIRDLLKWWHWRCRKRFCDELRRHPAAPGMEKETTLIENPVWMVKVHSQGSEMQLSSQVLFLLGFCCWNKHCDPKQLGEEGVTVHHVEKLGQELKSCPGDRNWRRGHRGRLLLGFLLEACSACFFFYRP